MKSEYGCCCICESTLNVNNLIQLDYKVESESGWGCGQCGLEAKGAMAIVCDVCIEKHGHEPDLEDRIKLLMSGIKRIPVPPVADRVPHGHDLSRHPEVSEWSENENT